MSQKRKIREFTNLTQASETVAKEYLAKNSWNVQRASNDFFDNPPKAVNSGGKDFFMKYRDISDGVSRACWSFGHDASIPQLCADWGIDQDDQVLFVLAWKCNCKDLGVFYLEEFLSADLDNVDSISKLKSKTKWLRKELQTNFQKFYTWLFEYSKNATKRHLDTETAIDMWALFLKDKFMYYDQWLEYLEEYKIKDISKDVWNQLYPFGKHLKSNPKLLDYESGVTAWPFDDFVEYLRNKKVIPTPKPKEDDEEEDYDEYY